MIVPDMGMRPKTLMRVFKVNLETFLSIFIVTRDGLDLTVLAYCSINPALASRLFWKCSQLSLRGLDYAL